MYVGDTSEKYAQQINKMHRKLQCLHLALVNRKCPILIQDNVQPHITQQMLQKLDDWTTKFWLICHIHLISRQLMGTSSSISMTFCRENTSTTSRRQRMLPRARQILKYGLLFYQIRSDQSLSPVRLFVTPWITARQASLSITNSWSSLRLTSIHDHRKSHSLD